MILWLQKEQTLPVWLARQGTAVTLITELKNSLPLTAYVRSVPCTQFHPPQGEIKQQNEDELKFCSQTRMCQIQALRQMCVQPGIQAETLYFYRVIGSHCNPQWGLNMRWCFGKTAPCREDALGCFSLSCLTDTVCWMTGRELQGAHPQQQESSPEPVIFWRLEKDVGKVIMTIS